MTGINTSPQKIEEILTRGVQAVFTRNELKEKLLSGKQLHIKLGIDVTGPNIHLGHTVVQRKLRDFQELGHTVTLIIGDFTTLVGDHSDKVEMRETANAKEIEKNAKTYTQQFFKTVKKDQTEVRYNSEWLKNLHFGGVIELAQQFTIAQMLERENFMKRYKTQKPIGLDEFLYPLMQGYDSVALKCDAELGGTDQTFNVLAGRKIMPHFNLAPQNCLIMNLLTGSDGKPMGKSLQNFIPVMASAIDMYGKLMSIVDEIIFEYFELVTRVPMSEIEKMKKAVEAGENPMRYKKLLAQEVVAFYHSKEAAEKATKVFEETVQNKEISQELIQKVSLEEKLTEATTLLAFLKKALTEENSKSEKKVSSAEIKRTIAQGGVEVNKQKVTDANAEIEFKPGDLVKFGKRVFIEVE